MLIDDGLLVAGRTGTGHRRRTSPPSRCRRPCRRSWPRGWSTLMGAQRRVLEGASVVGEVFEWSAVAELVPGGAAVRARRTPDVPRPQGSDPARRPSDLSDGDAFRFRHLLIRDAAYEGMAKETRAELHERFARWLEGLGAERLPEMQGIVGYHLERAFRYREELGASRHAWTDLAREAAGHLGEAGRRSLARADMPAAANLLERAIRLLSPEDPLPAAAHDRRCWTPSGSWGSSDLVERLADEGMTLARAAGDRGLELPVRAQARVPEGDGRFRELPLARQHRRIRRDRRQGRGTRRHHDTGRGTAQDRTAARGHRKDPRGGEERRSGAKSASTGPASSRPSWRSSRP